MITLSVTYLLELLLTHTLELPLTCPIDKTPLSSTSGIAELNTGKSSRKAEKSMGGISSERSLKDQLELWDEYLKAETVLGLTVT